MRHLIQRCGIAMFLSMLLCGEYVYSQTPQPIRSPFTVLSNNADTANNYLFVELMYEKSACRDYEARFFRTSRNNPNDSVPVKISAFLNNLGTFETDADSLRLKRPTAGGYRLQFKLPDVPNAADSGYRICVKSYTLAYRCVGCAAGGSDAVFAAADIDPSCPYTGSDLLACYRRESREGNWEAWIQDERDCKPYRIVAMPDGRWWLAQNLNYQKDLTPYSTASSGSTAAPGRADAGYWCPGGKSFGSAGVTAFANDTTGSGGTAACTTYGALYTWATATANNGRGAATAQGICPEGWLLPTSDDWGVLLNAAEGCPSPLTADGVSPCNHLRSDATAVGFMGSNNVKAALKTTQSCPPHVSANDPVCAKVNLAAWSWHRADYKGKIATPLALGNDRYGFSLHPAGFRVQGGTSFSHAGTGTRFWTASASGTTAALSRSFTNNDKTVELALSRKDMGMSVRCVSAESAVSGFFIYPAGSSSITMAADAGSLKLSAQSLGAGYTYTWTPATLATNVTLAGSGNTATITNSTANGMTVGSSYTVTVTATNGTDSYTTSKTITVVATPPVELPTLGLAGIYASPNVGSRSATAKFSAYSSVQPAGATYTWTATPHGGALAWDMSSMNTATITTTTPAVSGKSTYTITLTMKAEGYKTASTSTEFTVRGCDEIVQAAITPAEQKLCPGATPAALTAVISGGDPANRTILWEQKIGSGAWTAAPGTNNLEAYTPAAPTSVNAVILYRRKVVSCEQTHYSGEAKITTYPKITQPNVLALITRCTDTEVSRVYGVAKGGVGSGYTYQWQSSRDNINFTNEGSAAADVPNLTFNTGATNDDYIYHRRIAWSTTCPAIRDTSVTHPTRVLNSGPTFSLTAVTRTSCPGQSIAVNDVRVNALEGATLTMVRWYKGTKTTNAAMGWTTTGEAAAVNPSASTPTSTYLMEHANITAQPTVNQQIGYQVRATSCGITTTSATVLLVTTGGIATNPALGSLKGCPGAAYTINPSAATSGAGATGTLQYKWQWSDSPDPNTFTDVTNPASAGVWSTTRSIATTVPAVDGATKYYRRVARRDGCGNEENYSVVMPLTASSNITQAVLADVQSCAGDSVTLTLAAAANATEYQWQHMDMNNNRWADMPGETSLTCTIPAPAAGKSAYYRRVAYSNNKTCSLVGNSARVYSPEASVGVGRDMKSLYETAPNTTVLLSPTVSGAGVISYQWYSSPDNNIFSPVAGATNSTYEVTLTDEGEYSPYYRLTATVACGDLSSTSNTTQVHTTLGCPYKGADLLEGSCVQRTTGAKNWEAQIVDKRDNNRTYRIVLMPGGDWWFAENLAYKKGEESKDWQYNFWDDPSTYQSLGLQYPYFSQPCPAGWRAPEVNDWKKMLNCAIDNCGGNTYALPFNVDGQAQGNSATSFRLMQRLRINEPWQLPQTTDANSSIDTGAYVDYWGFALKCGMYGSTATDAYGYTGLRASSTNSWILLVRFRATSTAPYADIDTYISGRPDDIKSGTAAAGSYVRCVADTAKVASTAPTQITATYIALANNAAPAMGTTTLVASGGTEAMGSYYRWGTGTTPGENIIPNATSDKLENLSPIATTTYWAQRSNSDGTWAAGAATIEVKVQPCPYVPSGTNDLVDAQLCRQRGTGNQNWEAYIQDTRDNKKYRVVYMPDGQWWMAQNLNYQEGLTYREKAAQPTTATTAAAVTSVKGSFWCPQGVYVGDAATVTPGGLPACDVWGALYPWSTSMSLNGSGALSAASDAAPSGVQGVCPPNWHLPSHTEWAKTLACAMLGNCSDGTYLSSYNTWLGENSKRLKGSAVRNPVIPSQLGWIYSGSQTGTDDFGFSVYPAGYRNENGNYYSMGVYEMFETSEEAPTVNAEIQRKAVVFHYSRNQAYIANTYYKTRSVSVRCARNLAAVGLSSIPPSYVNATYTAMGTRVPITLTAVGATLATGAQYEWGRGEVGTGIIAITAANTYTLTPNSQTDTAFWVRIKESGGAVSSAALLNIKIQPETCPYKGGDLVAGSCKLRTTGAKNWTATIKDARDGKTYNIALMPDGRWWQAENMKFTKDLTDAVRDNLPNTSTGSQNSHRGYYWCPSASSTVNTENQGVPANCDKFGVLYPWLTAMSTDGVIGALEPHSLAIPSGVRGVCPIGWHLPSSPEAQVMFDCVEGNCANRIFANGASDARWAGIYVGQHLKGGDNFRGYRGTEGWDSYGFNGQAAGFRNYTGSAIYMTGIYGQVWTSSSASGGGGGMYYLHSDYASLYNQAQYDRAYGMPARCVWDGEEGTPTITTKPESLTADASAAPTGTVVNFKVSGGTMSSTAAIQWGKGAVSDANAIAGQTADTLAYTMLASGNTIWARYVDNGTPSDALTLTLNVEACPSMPDHVIAGTCRRSPDGAKNWVARMKDPRDNKEYKIALLNKWYMAEYLRYTTDLRENMEWMQGNKGVDYQFPAYLKTNGTDGVAFSNARPNTPPAAGFSSSRTATVQGVCPTGWHIQSAAEANGFAMKVLGCSDNLDFLDEQIWSCTTSPNEADALWKNWGLSWLNPLYSYQSCNVLTFQNGVGSESAAGVNWHFPSRYSTSNYWSNASGDLAYGWNTTVGMSNYVACVADLAKNVPPASITSSAGTTVVGSTASTLTVVGGTLGSGESYRWSRGATPGATVLQTNATTTYAITAANMNSWGTTTYHVQTGSTANGWSGAASITVTVLPTGSFVYRDSGAANVKTVTLAANTKYRIEVWGAQGGFCRRSQAVPITDAPYPGGKGAYAAGTITIGAAARTVYVHVGGQGGVNPPSPRYIYGKGGYGGGGDGGYDNDASGPENSPGGGGSSDVRLVSGAWDKVDGLRSRIIVAGGGGGAAMTSGVLGQGSPGGGLAGLGQSPVTNGGTQIAQVTNATYYDFFGWGERGAHNPAGNQSACGGNGGGYWGGVNGTQEWVATRGGAGGSSFISGHAGCNAVTSATSSAPKGNPNHYSGLVFTETVMEDGVREGNGMVVITKLP